LSIKIKFFPSKNAFSFAFFLFFRFQPPFMKLIALQHPSRHLQARLPLPTSKSESNRLLIIEALAKAQGPQPAITWEALAAARDTQTMQRLLQSQEEVLDVLDAGTTMRFLTAYCTVTQRAAVLTGTARMCERPIHILVEALRHIGADIEYLGKEGFPPLRIKAFAQRQSLVRLRGDVSSQYISALLMVAPLLPQGLTIEIEGTLASRPYVQMSLELMAYMGVQHRWDENRIFITPQSYQLKPYRVEADWSGASYWFSAMALAEEGTLYLEGLKEQSLQGDKAILHLGDALGVLGRFDAGGLHLSKKEAQKHLSWDFSDCPDLAQSVVACCAAKGIVLEAKGLESLRIKETDRIAALQKELAKIGARFEESSSEKGLFVLHPAQGIGQQPRFASYDDHRMAMAFAPLALCGSILIEEPTVVAKSYPSFWDDCRRAGFVIEESSPN